MKPYELFSLAIKFMESTFLVRGMMPYAREYLVPLQPGFDVSINRSPATTSKLTLRASKDNSSEIDAQIIVPANWLTEDYPDIQPVKGNTEQLLAAIGDRFESLGLDCNLRLAPTFSVEDSSVNIGGTFSSIEKLLPALKVMGELAKIPPATSAIPFTIKDKEYGNSFSGVVQMDSSGLALVMPGYAGAEDPTDTNQFLWLEAYNDTLLLRTYTNLKNLDSADHTVNMSSVRNELIPQDD